MDYKVLLERFVKMVYTEGDAYHVVRNYMQSDYYRDESGTPFEGQEELAHIFTQEEIDEIIRIFGCDPRESE